MDVWQSCKYRQVPYLSQVARERLNGSLSAVVIQLSCILYNTNTMYSTVFDFCIIQKILIALTSLVQKVHSGLHQ